MRKTETSLRIGFLGTGYIADWHAKSLKAIPGVTLAAVCDQDLARARSFGERYGVARSYPTLDEMLGDRELGLDAVHVLLPPDLHARAACQIIDSGLHVLLEKPMATSADQCTELIERAKARGVKIGINHNFLFAPVYEALKADLASGKLGRLDQVTITWYRELGQLHTGPFNIWMLRDPRNIMLEIGPHSMAQLLDLIGPLEITGVRATNPIDLPGGCRFYRRWQVDTGRGATAATLSYSFTPGFGEYTIHVRGSLASATVDLERNTYILQRHTKYGLDYDQYCMTSAEAGALKAQARRTFAHYVLSKFKLSTQGSPYGLSITRALQSFYARLSDAIDSRLSPELGRDVIGLCSEIGRLAAIEPPAASSEVSTLPEARPALHPEILVLGATGFIGQELARQLLSQGHTIRVLVRNPGRLPVDLRATHVDMVVGNLSQEADLNRALAGIRCVYHLARANVKTWEEFVTQDIEVTRRIAEACLAQGVARLIYTGTIDSYYAGIRASTITEETPLDPHIQWRNLYAQAKAASEEILRTLHRDKGLPVVIFRPGIVIGQGSSPFHWGIGMWSWNSVCQIWGQGRNPLPLVLVEDVAAALVAALETKDIEGESFNLVTDSDISACDYLKALEDYAGVAFQKIPTPLWKFYSTDLVKWVVKRIVRHPDQRRPSFRDWESRTQRARFDCSKARRKLNWNPISDQDEIIRRGIHRPASEFLA